MSCPFNNSNSSSASSHRSILEHMLARLSASESKDFKAPVINVTPDIRESAESADDGEAEKDRMRARSGGSINSPDPVLGTGPFTSLGTEIKNPLSVWLNSKLVKNKSAAESSSASALASSEEKTAAADGYESGKTHQYTEEITYWNYIHPQVLTSLQKGRQGKGLNHHEEHLFILVHQVFELWFKQIIFELEYVRDSLIGIPDKSELNQLATSLNRLTRADKILRLATQGYEIMETMNPADFLQFRDSLNPSSGFQSVQMREIEILIGLKDDERIPCAGRHYREAFIANGDDFTHIFDKRLAQQSIKEGLYAWIARIHLPSLDEFLSQFLIAINTQSQANIDDKQSESELLEKILISGKLTDPKELAYIAGIKSKTDADRKSAIQTFDEIKQFFSHSEFGAARTRILFLFTYHSHHAISAYSSMINGLLNLEQGFTIWRQRHGRMVEVFIGRKPGTGGSSGVEYVEATAQVYRVFKDLWRIRSLQIARDKIQFDVDQALKNMQ